MKQLGVKGCLVKGHTLFLESHAKMAVASKLCPAWLHTGSTIICYAECDVKKGDVRLFENCSRPISLNTRASSQQSEAYLKGDWAKKFIRNVDDRSV